MHKNKDFFIKKYLEFGKRIEEVAKYFNISRALAFRYAKKYGLTNGKKLKRHSIDIDYFRNIDNQNKAYWLGFIMADGCIFKGPSPRSYILQINLAEKDRDVLEKFNQEVKSDYPIKEYDTTDNNGKSHKCVALCISKSDFCVNLLNHGIVLRKTYKAKMPNIDMSLYRHFIRGLFDGDGNIGFPKRENSVRTSFSIVGNYNLLSSILMLLKENNIYTNIYRTHSENAWSLESSKRSEVKKIYNYLYDNATTYLTRKKLIFDRINSLTCPSIEKSIDKSLA